MNKSQHIGWSILVNLAFLSLVFRADSPACGEPDNNTGPVVKVSTFWSDTGVRPGGQISLAVVLDIREHYHVNSATAKEFPTTVELSNSLGDLRYSTPIFPSPHEIEFGVGDAKQNIEVFSERAIIYVPMAVTDSAKAGEKEIHVKVTYQACDDRKCLLPADFTQTTKLVVVEKTAQIEKINEELFKGLKERKERLNVSFFGWDFKFMPSKLWILLMVAAVGGFLLNLTPCVLPLIPVKIMGLSRAAGNRQRCFLLGVAMSLGVVTFWLALAIGVSSIRGFATNKLFQYPIFTITIGVIICIMAAGMCGFFITRLPQWTYRINPSQESGMGSFLFGIMTAVLSTPCTAPFMGAAAAWSVTQGPAITLGTFAAIGIGMALPYLILSACPILVNRMPRTGPASDLIKQVMGLLMVAAGAYFLGTGVAGLLANPPDPPTQAYWWIVAFFIAAAGFWLMWRTVQITTRTGNRVGFGIVGTLLIVAAVGLGFRFTRGSPIKWIYYTPERLAEAQKQQKVVVLDFTAAWCLNCHVLEQAVLHHPQVVKLMNSEGVTPIKVDITGNNPTGNQKLVEVGRRTIPYLVIYSGSGEETFSSDAYTVEQIVEAIHRAKSQHLNEAMPKKTD